jgi:beta-lactamase class A
MVSDERDDQPTRRHPLTSTLNRRSILGLGATATAGLTLGAATVASARARTAESPATRTTFRAAATTTRDAAGRVDEVYQRESRRAGGVWNSFITLADPSGTLTPAVADKADEAVEAYSVNKLGVATAVLDKVDRGQLRLDQKVDVTADIVATTGDGIFPLDRVYPSSVTLGHVMANLLSVSDDTAARLCGLVCPAKEINSILVTKGFPQTQVQLVDNPNRFFLGKTTPRETHDLLRALLYGKLLSPASTSFMIDILRSQVAFTDGIRRNMSTGERARVATKAGWFADGRNEAGVMFDAIGRPVLTYAIFAHGQADPDNFAATHPAIEARAVMGREFFDDISALGGVTARMMPMRRYSPRNGG